MKYQYYVIGKQGGDPPAYAAVRAFYVPIEVTDGKRVPCGPPIELTSRTSTFDLMLDAEEFEVWDACPTELADITPPEGWELVAQFPLPDDYVPESTEVQEEAERRSRQFFKDMGLFND